jgi:hypothetical protein
VCLGALLVLVSAMTGGATARRAAAMQELVGVSVRTLRRWRAWWLGAARRGCIDGPGSCFWLRRRSRSPRSPVSWAPFAGEGVAARRFEAEGIEGLKDEPRSGRPARITSLERHQVIAAACSDPSEYGLERSVWSHESLAHALEDSGEVGSISSSTVGRILADAEIKPHRVKTWCHSTDPVVPVGNGR